MLESNANASGRIQKYTIPMCKGKNKRRWKAYKEIGLTKNHGRWQPKGISN